MRPVQSSELRAEADGVRHRHRLGNVRTEGILQVMFTFQCEKRIDYSVKLLKQF